MSVIKDIHFDMDLVKYVDGKQNIECFNLLKM